MCREGEGVRGGREGGREGGRVREREMGILCLVSRFTEPTRLFLHSTNPAIPFSNAVVAKHLYSQIRNNFQTQSIHPDKCI